MKILTSLFLILTVFSFQDAFAQSDWCRYGQLPVPKEIMAPVLAQPPVDHILAVYYVVPKGMPFEYRVYDRIVRATLDIQAWYQCATGGLTWKLAFPEVVKVYYGDQTRESYQNDWWGLLLTEMGSKGYPIWARGTVTALLARGAGGWAGAAQGCAGECGIALLGVESFPELNKVEWSGRECPCGFGGTAWPCTPEGALAHELGHTLGLPHPYDVPETRAYAYHSIMQTHWNYPNYAPPSESPWGFLTLERQRIRSNPFMHWAINLMQPYPDCDVVNLPLNGPTPVSNFEVSFDQWRVELTNYSEGNGTELLYYWTLGDGSVSNNSELDYIYQQAGTYIISLRASNEFSMMSIKENTVPQTGSPPEAPTGLRATPGMMQAGLVWNVSIYTDSYNIKRSIKSGGPYSTIVTGIATTNFTDTGLTNGITYYYVVTAVNGIGESGPSNEANATPSGGNVVFEEIKTGGSSSSATVATFASLAGVANHLYLSAISTKPGSVTVKSVTGLGLTWTLVKAQCAGRNQTRVEVWKAMGTPTGSGVVTAMLSGAALNAVIEVSRYSGVNGTTPIGNIVSANTKGVNGSCSGGVDSASYSVDLMTTSSNCMAYGAAAIRHKSHTPGSGYTERAEVMQGSGGDAAGEAVEDKTVASPSAVPVNGTFSGAVDWAVVAVEIRP